MNSFEKYKKFLIANNKIKLYIIDFEDTKDYIGLLEKIEKEFEIISDIYPKYEKIIKEKFDKLFDSLSFLKSSNRIKKFYEKYAYPLSGNVRKMVDDECIGYNQNMNIDFNKVKTINELLFVFHRIILSDENFIKSINVVKEDNNKSGNNIYIRGNDTKISSAIFNMFKKELNTEEVNILSVSENELYIMIKGIDKALFIEIRVNSENIYEISYFLPKVKDTTLVNKVKEIKESSNIGGIGFTYIKGMVDVKEEELIYTLYNVLSILTVDLYNKEKNIIK